MNNIIWVQGEMGAKAFAIAPNTTMALWDSEAQIIYLKQSDAVGRPTMQILDYTIREQKDELTALRDEIKALKEELRGIKNEPAISNDEQEQPVSNAKSNKSKSSSISDTEGA